MRLPKSIAILEDDHRRRVEMFRVLDDRFFLNRVLFFRTAPEMLAWLEESSNETLLLSLDHDLHDVEGEVNGAGTGMDVVEFLVARSASLQRFPVVIHSTSVAAESMGRSLIDSGWAVARVTPYDDLEWIERSWYQELKNSLKSPLNPGVEPTANGGPVHARTTGTAR